MRPDRSASSPGATAPRPGHPIRPRTGSAAGLLAALGLLALPGLAPGAAALEGQAFGIGANYGYYTVNGTDFEGTEGGWGYEAFASLSPSGGGGGMPGGGGPMGGGGGMGIGGLASGGFAIGVGIKQSRHGFEGADDDLTLRQIFLSPGLNFAPTDSRVRLSVRTRGGLAQLDLGENESGETIDATGFEVGGSVGAEIFLVEFLAIEPSVAASYINFEEPGVDDGPGVPGFPIPIPGAGTGERLGGWTLGFRLGLNVLLR